MESTAGKSYQYLMEIQIQDKEAPVCELYGKKWQCGCACYAIHPKLKLEGQAGESAAVWVTFSTLQEQLSSLNVKKNHFSAPLVGTLSRVVATHAY